MDQHPIPQDVTGFQFKLIGSMTVKQFGYIAVGVVTAFGLYYIPLSSNQIVDVFLKIILIPLFGGSGFLIAFVPIEGRPIDVMASNFAKAILSPNRYIYHKQGKKLSFLALTLTPQTQAAAATTQTPSTQAQKARADKEQRLHAMLIHSSSKARNKEDEQEMAMLRSFANMAGVTQTTPVPAGRPKAAIPTHAVQPMVKQTVSQATPVATAQPTLPQQAIPTAQNLQAPAPTQTPDGLSQQEKVLEQELLAAKQAEGQQQAPAASQAAHVKVETLQKQLEDVHLQKQHLEQELIRLKSQLSTQQPVSAPVQAMQQTVAVAASPVQTATLAPSVSQPTSFGMQASPAVMPQPQQPQTHAVPEGMMKKVGLPHTSDTPNVVVGVVKDPRDNVLPNVLVEIKDNAGNPVRAFKTNTLGQFASATPLPVGTYTIELEDPKKQHNFDVIQIAANNQILLPIEIISHDAREALRQQLFN